DARFGKACSEAFTLEDFLEQVLEAPVIGFDDRVLRREVHRPTPVETVVEAGASEIADGVVEIVHRHGDAWRLELIDLAVDRLPIFTFEHQAQRAGAWHQEVGGAVLVAKSMAAD